MYWPRNGCARSASGNPLPPDVLLGDTVTVLETVYTPSETPLVTAARTAGARVATGDAMFRRQAARQFELFTGKEAARDLMREAVLDGA